MRFNAKGMAHAMQSFIADGFADDCDELIHQCVKEAPVTYKVFSDVFKSMQVSSLFHDRSSGSEIAELSEEVINIAKYYMVANTGSFEETAAGVFLVYALVNLQPFQGFASLRLVDDDVPYIERIEQVARRDKRVDVLYVLGKILSEHTVYLAAARERGMEPSYRKYLEGCSIESLGLRPKGVFLRQNEELDIIRDLAKLEIRYSDKKAKAGAYDLCYIDTKFPTDMDISLKNIVSGFIHENDKKDNLQEEDDRDKIKALKDKAMKAKVNPMKHLMGVQDRSPSKPLIPHTSDLKTPVGKIKTGSPTKRVITTRSKIKAAPQRLKRKRESHESDETSDESMESLHLSEDSDCDDINVDKFNRTAARPIEDLNQQVLEVDGGNIRMGALPCLVTCEDSGRTYEIEVIDKLLQPTVNKTINTGRRAFTPTIEETIKKPIDKRDLKNTIVKSRFKRMGIEPIANFKS